MIVQRGLLLFLTQSTQTSTLIQKWQNKGLNLWFKDSFLFRELVTKILSIPSLYIRTRQSETFT